MSRKAAKVAKAQTRGRGRGPFYAVIGVIVAAGAFLLFRSVGHQGDDSFDLDPALLASLTAESPRGFLLGDSNAPVLVKEFADFECTACMSFATLTEPDVRRQLVETGQIAFEYYFFPLQQHPNSGNAAHAAACAGDQNLFWEMHDAIFHGFNTWALQESRNPKRTFQGYARSAGLDVAEWERCYDDRRHHDLILSHIALGVQVGVNSTPTFMFNGRVVPGALRFEQFRDNVAQAMGQVRAEAQPEPAEAQ